LIQVRAEEAVVLVRVNESTAKVGLSNQSVNQTGKILPICVNVISGAKARSPAGYLNRYILRKINFIEIIPDHIGNFILSWWRWSRCRHL